MAMRLRSAAGPSMGRAPAHSVLRCFQTTLHPRSAPCTSSGFAASSPLIRQLSAHPAGTVAPRVTRASVATKALSGTPSSSSPKVPFSEAQYHRVTFVNEPWGPIRIYTDSTAHGSLQFTGVMVFKPSTSSQIDVEDRVLEVFVAGDTAVNIHTLVHNQRLERPMVHDVMFSILQQAQAGDPRRWGLLKVAIVSLENDVFVGRLYFGDPLTQTVHWEVDCRPSDGCFLSIKSNAPLYVHRDVWEAASKPLNETTAYQMAMEDGSSGDAESSSTSSDPADDSQPSDLSSTTSPGNTNFDPEEESLSNRTHREPALQPHAFSCDSVINQLDFMALDPEDLGAIKLLKRKLAIAISEEDYQAAASIRDHPFMRLYKEVVTKKKMGKHADALILEMELVRQVEGLELRSHDPRC